MAPKITQEDLLKLLNSLYNQSEKGLGKVSKPISEVCDEYLNKYETKEVAFKKFAKAQLTKCTTSGFITGFGGIITLPVTIPANISSVLYTQMRLIAGAAYMGGYNLDEDEVQTFVYACLAGVSMGGVVKKFGAHFGHKVAVAGIRKIPGKTLTAINQKIGFRFITKFGEKGLINLGKMVPVAGAAINGGFDFVETKAIANRANRMFLQNDFSVGEPLEAADIVIINHDES